MAILKLQASYKDYFWGGDRLKKEYNKVCEQSIVAESWELSCHADGHSKILNGIHKGKTLQEYIDEVGLNVLGTNCQKYDFFPLLVKFIDAKDRLSIQVHPNNEYALKHENEYGKAEVWYICDCDKDSFIYYGFSKKIDEKEFRERINNNTLVEVLNAVSVKKGDVFFIEAGTIHAIGENILLAEIQQNSNITYRVYDYDRVCTDGKKRPLHIEKALEVAIRSLPKKNTCSDRHLVQCDFFTVDRINISSENTLKLTQSEKSFIHFLILEGSGTISMAGESIIFEKGDSLFVPTGSSEFLLEGICEALMTRVE